MAGPQYRQKLEPRSMQARIKNQRSNVLDNYYGFDRIRDVRTEPSLPHKFQYRDPETNRTGIYNYDPRPPKGSIPRDFLRQRQPGIEQFNMRPPREGIMGADIAAIDPRIQTADASGVFSALKDYKKKIEDRVGKYNFGENKYEYDYEKELGPGTLGLGGNYDFDDNQYGLNIGYKMIFDDGGIATLPTPEGMQREKVPLTDEQKDYLYDFMLDFMFKQRQREQQEMEGRIPPFNYEGLEV